MDFAIFTESQISPFLTRYRFPQENLSTRKYYNGLFLGIFYPFARKARWWHALDAYNFLCFLFWIFGY